MALFTKPEQPTYALCEDGEIRRVVELMTEEGLRHHQRLREQRYEDIRNGQQVVDELLAAKGIAHKDGDTVRLTGVTTGKDNT